MTRSLAPKRPRPAIRKYLSVAAERLIADCYPGQVLAAVIERAIRQMAIRDGLLQPKPADTHPATEETP